MKQYNHEINQSMIQITLLTSLQFKIKQFPNRMMAIQPNAQSHNKTQYLNLIDKCTQIIREDRIWLRNLLKANNQDILYLFKGIPKNIDMKQLQIKLRKYIMRAKEKQKHQQLMRFKQNMQLPEFVEVAAQKRQQPQYHNKSQTKFRGPLKQQSSNEAKSSFVAKWNNYTHYNPSIHLTQNRSQLTNMKSLSQTKNTNKQWSNNYKPHSFNKNLNGELANKLSSKNNSSLSRPNRHNKSSTSLTKEKMSIVNSRFQNEEVDEMNHSSKYPFAGERSSSKSLKQLENKIYEQLRIFQHNKAKKQAQILNRSYSQRSVQKATEKEKQKPQQNMKQVQPKQSSMSKENIDEILKYKLGNCDYEAYRKSQQTEQDEDPTDYVFQEKTTSQKKLYDGMFPPIEEQTERDSESQRYPEEPLRFGMMNINNSKTDFQDKHKITFSSFAKASPSQILGNYDINDSKMIASTGKNVREFHEEGTQINHPKAQSSLLIQRTKPNDNYQEPIVQHKISESLYASAQRKSDVNQNYIESDLHKSIMDSINKNRHSFNNLEFSNQSRPIDAMQFTSQTLKNFNYIPEKSRQPPVPQISTSISSFQSSLYSSTHDDQGLFTSPELLNQCRNFLKKTQQINFQNSGLKQMAGSVVHSKFDSPVSSQQKSFRQTFNNPSDSGIVSFPQPITITQSITKDFYDSQARINTLFQSKQSSTIKGNNIEFQTYSKPEYIGGRQSFKKSDYMQSSMKKSDFQTEFMGHQSSMKKDEVNAINHHSRKASSMKKHSEIQETIALPLNQGSQFNMSNNSRHEEKEPLTYTQPFKTSQFPNFLVQQDPIKIHAIKDSIEKMIDLENIIDLILEANQGNIEVDSTWLKHTINNQCIFNENVGALLRNILAQFINSEATYNFIQIMNCVQKQFKKNPSYEPRKSPSRDICSILDIEEKGFITFDDIQNFATQLQSAGVQQIEEIARCLQEVFDIADFMGKRQISYINLYIISKHQDCFENLWNHLQAFEFQVSGAQQ